MAAGLFARCVGNPVGFRINCHHSWRHPPPELSVVQKQHNSSFFFFIEERICYINLEEETDENGDGRRDERSSA